MTRAALLVLLLAGTAGASPKLPAHYAKLFDPDATWTYARERDEVACKVVRTTTIGKIVASEVTCTSGDEFPVSGVYLAAPDGLYLSGTGFPESKADLGPMVLHQLLVTAEPKASAKKVVKFAPTADRVMKVETTSGVRRDGKLWCWYRTTAYGSSPPHTDTRCFDGGIAYGSEGGVAFRAK